MPNFDLTNYVPVNERLQQFYEKYPDGRVVTTIVEHDREKGFVMFEAQLFRTLLSERPAATGHAFEERTAGYVNKTSYVENAETSAVGRALALLGFSIERGIASREEMQKVQRMTATDETGNADRTVERENGHYRVGNFKVQKLNGRVICSCKAAGCGHIDAVRKFAAANGDAAATAEA